MDSEFFTAKLATLDALFFYLSAFEKSNLLAEMLGVMKCFASNYFVLLL